jgi:thiol-disulfide isomerase/thioredoxin
MTGKLNHPTAGRRRFPGLAGAAVLAVSLLAVAQPAPAAALDLEAHRGKVVVLDFWASWCVPCRRSFPWLNAIQARYGTDDLVIIGVNLDESRQDAETFLAEYPPQFQIVYDETRSLAREFGVEAMPMSFVIGRDGELMARHYGFKVKKQGEYEAVIAEALAQEE